MTERCLNKVERRLPEEYTNLHNVVDDWTFLESPKRGDIIDICKSYNVNDKMIIEDLVKAYGGNLTTLVKQISRYQDLKRREVVNNTPLLITHKKERGKRLQNPLNSNLIKSY